MTYSITLLIVIMTGIISYQAFENPRMKGRLLFVPDVINRMGQYDRFLTHGFIHGDWMHLLINLFVLHSFGEAAEFRFKEHFGALNGAILYTVLYIGGIVVSSIPSYIKHKDNRLYGALGASGAVSAVVFVNIFFNPWSEILLYLFIPIPIVLAGIAYLMYSDYMGKNGNDNIGHDAHFYGAVWGFSFTVLVAAIFKPELMTQFMDLLLFR
ncbi:MAG: rhomboid family intramembrane serine protease [Saprospiraceae bacterium]